MVSSTPRGGSTSRLAELLESARRPVNRANTRSFGEELKAASASGRASRTERTEEPQRQIVGTAAGSRPNSVNAEPARTSAPQAPAAAPAVQQPPSMTAARAESGPTEHAAVIALRDALSAAGLNTAGVNFEYVDQTVGYPGGSYQNRLITVTLPSGVKENFGADLVMRNPQVTVVEIQNLLRRPVAT